MKILLLFSLLSSFSVRALAHDEANSGRDNDYENLEPEIDDSRKNWDELSDSVNKILTRIINKLNSCFLHL